MLFSVPFVLFCGYLLFCLFVAISRDCDREGPEAEGEDDQGDDRDYDALRSQWFH